VQDRLQVVPRLVLDEVHRAFGVVSRPGGKGMIVAPGAAGLSYRSSSEGWDVRSPVVSVVNATGSGDMMLAGFVTALVRGGDRQSALRTGAAAGAAHTARLEPDLSGPDEVADLRGQAVATAVPVVLR
jgi:fructose-1-phosphate kinase PfkB-like protein